MANKAISPKGSGYRRPGIVFAMRYDDSIGFVWNTIAANRDLIAERLTDDLECYVAYPKLSGNPSYVPRELKPVELDCYDTSAGGLARLKLFIQAQGICAIVYMSALPTSLKLDFFKRLGVWTINTENDSFDRCIPDHFVLAALKLLVRRGLKQQLHDLHIANARSQADWLTKNAHIPADRLVVVNDGIDCQRFVPLTDSSSAVGIAGMDTHKQWVICAGQSRPEKRVDAIIRLARRVLDLRPNLSVGFIYVGAGPCLTEWQQLAGTLGLDGKFVFAGAQTDLVPYFQAASLMVHTSERESFGLVLAEAMACGLPVVAYGAAGPREIVAKDITGELVEVGDEVALLAATLRYLDNPALAHQHGKAGRERVLSRYSITAQADLMAKHIRHICGLQKKASLIFAMRYPDDIGFVWKTIARTRDMVAEQLQDIVDCFIAYPKLTDRPCYEPKALKRIELNCYDASHEGSRKLEDYLRNNRIDAIVYMSALPSTLDMHLLKRLGVLTINTENDSFDQTRTDSLIKEITKFVVRRVMKQQLHHLHIANAESQGLWLSSYAKIPKDRLVVVPNGVDVEYFVPGCRVAAARKLSLSPDCRWIVCASQAREEKRIDFIIEAASKIITERPDLKIGFIYVGDGPCMENWRRIVYNRNITEHFIFAGRQEDLLPYYQIASVFVHAASRESYGLVISEAMSCALPIVACSAAGPAELVIHENTGFLVELDDSVGFARAICKYLDSPELAKQHGQMGRTRVKKYYSIYDQTLKIAKAIRNLIGPNLFH